MRSICIECGAPGETPGPGELETEREPPRCGGCGGLLRPGVVWFGELLPSQALQRARGGASSADVMLIIGTSGVVWPAAELPLLAKASDATLIEVNPFPGEITPMTDIFLRGPAGGVLPELVAAVRRMRVRE